VTSIYECKGGPADGELVEIPASMPDVVLVPGASGTRERYVVRAWARRDRSGRPLPVRHCLVWDAAGPG
jgi:hypothetical protein